MTVEAGPNTVSSSMVLSLDSSNYKSYNSSENLYTYSEDFSQSVWLKGASVTVTANSGIAPDNTNTANKIVLDVGWAGQIPVYRSANTSALSTYTESFYVKAAGWNYAYLWFDNGSGFGCTLEINLLTGATRNTRIGDNTYYTGFSTSVISVGNGWYRISITATMTASGTGVQFRIYPSNVAWVSGNFGTPSGIVGDGVNGIYIWGGQFEKSNGMSKYTKTTTATITRATTISDLSPNLMSGTLTGGHMYTPLNNGTVVLNGTSGYINIANFKNYFDFNSAFTISAWVNPSNTSSVDVISTYSSASNDGIWLELATASNQVRFVSRNLGTAVFDLYSSETIGTGTWKHIVATYDATTAKIYINGVQSVNTAAATTIFPIANLDLFIGRIDASLGRYLGGSIGPVNIYNRALSSAEVSQNFDAIRGRYGI